ncbi:MAG: biotin/lipoyl-binding protein [Propionibacteriaceae bacterium]|jgi:biotin carboxyl carrier protein|nr:biotin/lipoyl-binding protein [Propionibacteriaceae bacterium]
MTHYTIRVGDTVHSIDVEDKGADEFTVRLEDGREFTAALVSDQAAHPVVDRSEADRYEADQRVADQREADRSEADRPVVDRPGADAAVPSSPPIPAAHPSDRPDGAAAPAVAGAPPAKVTRVAAPLPCLVLSVAVRPGDRVTRGQTILEIEAMKMRNDIKAPRDATVSKVLVAAGDTVPHGRPLVEFED